jgi:5-methylcytosine-specific restriction endonuclease McrA
MKTNLPKWIIPRLRSMSRFWPEKNEALNNAKVKLQIGFYKNGNPEYKTLFKCHYCEQLFDRTDIQVDHINPIVSVEGFKDWSAYIEALFCPANELQILCKEDHQAKSFLENQLRREIKKNNAKTRKD